MRSWAHRVRPSRYGQVDEEAALPGEEGQGAQLVGEGSQEVQSVGEDRDSSDEEGQEADQPVVEEGDQQIQELVQEGVRINFIRNQHPVFNFTLGFVIGGLATFAASSMIDGVQWTNNLDKYVVAGFLGMSATSSIALCQDGRPISQGNLLFGAACGAAAASMTGYFTSMVGRPNRIGAGIGR